MAYKKRADGLTDRQATFVREYLVDLNAAAAYRRAGYNTPKSKKTGLSIAGFRPGRLLKNPLIARMIAEDLAKRAKRTEITQDKVLKALWEIANLDPAGAYDQEGALLPVREMRKMVRKAVAGLDVVEQRLVKDEANGCVSQVRKVKFWDKVKALELLGKHLGMFPDKHVLEGGDKPIPVEVIEVHKQ